MRLMVIGDFRWNSGSSHVIREYVKHAPALGMEICVSSKFGSRDQQICSELPYREELKWATHLLIVFEGNPFLSLENIEEIDRIIPRTRRAVIDADGHWGSITQVGDDDNTWPCGFDKWQEQLNNAAELILQPAIFEASAGAVKFSYFGMPLPVAVPRRGKKRPYIDMQYIGSNWFRFAALHDVFSSCRKVIGNRCLLRVRGKYWDGTVRKGFETGTKADSDALNRLHVEVLPPVPFGEVVERMGDALITPVLVRPVLAARRLMTPRMLETVAASTIPVYRQDERFVGHLYNDDGTLCIGRESSKLREIVSDKVRFHDYVRDLRERLYGEYCYPSVLRRLKSLLA